MRVRCAASAATIASAKHEWPETNDPRPQRSPPPDRVRPDDDGVKRPGWRAEFIERTGRLGRRDEGGAGDRATAVRRHAHQGRRGIPRDLRAKRDARGMRTRPNGEPVVQVLPWDRFGAFMVSDQRTPWIERAWSPEVRIRGTLATVWAEYDFHFGQTPSHCGVDAVQLLKTPAGWKIVSIADTYETTGCPPREPPR